MSYLDAKQTAENMLFLNDWVDIVHSLDVNILASAVVRVNEYVQNAHVEILTEYLIVYMDTFCKEFSL